MPMVGWPANGISLPGVKMRTLNRASARSGGNRNTVSDRLNSRAIFCMRPSSNPRASGKTASWLPASLVWVKTSRRWKT